MAPTLPPVCILLILLFLLACCCYNTVQGGDEGFGLAEFLTLEPANVCSEWKAPSRNSLKVVHRFGPCSPSTEGRLDEAQILAQESRRVAFIQSRVRLDNAKLNTSMDSPQTSLEVTLPARDGMYLGIVNYIVTIGIGTPRRVQTVQFDTGSNLCWVQCMPCQTRYPQVDPIFDSTTSPTYRNVTCNDQACTLLPAYGGERGCANNVCTYHTRYADSSTTSGLLAMERMELSAPRMSPIVLPNFVFGCGQNNVGVFGRIAGMVGLGHGFHSLVTQAATRLGNVFSYCLPSMDNVPGYLTIGRRAAPSPMYTAMITGRINDLGLYHVDLVGITVARQRLQLSPSIFRNVATVIDSGTSFTYLPPEAYQALKIAFRNDMSHYQLAPPYNILDTCYTVHNPNGTYPPTVTLHFSGLDLPLSVTQTLVRTNDTRFCLAFAANERGEVTVIGNTQQKGMEVIYDIGARRIGFSRGTNCR